MKGRNRTKIITTDGGTELDPKLREKQAEETRIQKYRLVQRMRGEFKEKRGAKPKTQDW